MSGKRMDRDMDAIEEFRYGDNLSIIKRKAYLEAEGRLNKGDRISFVSAKGHSAWAIFDHCDGKFLVSQSGTIIAAHRITYINKDPWAMDNERLNLGKNATVRKAKKPRISTYKEPQDFKEYKDAHPELYKNRYLGRIKT